MATLNTTNPTLLDLASRLDPSDSSIAAIIELLHETNEIIDDATFIEGNLATGHKSTVRTGLPAPTWRKLYGGVQPTKSTTVPVVDTCGMLEAYAEVDKALADLNGNTAAFRMTEDRAHLEGMNQAFADTLLYGDTDLTPERFLGFAPRYDDSSGPENAANILSGGGSGSDNTSIWLIVWGPETVHGIYPKGSKAGFQMKDKGEVTVENADGAGGRMEAYRTHYRWDCGLTVRDWRYVIRIANIDVSDLTKNAATGADLVDLMAQAIELLPSAKLGRPAFYVNRTIKSFLRRQMANKSNVHLSLDQVAGKRVMSFDDIPVRRVDAIHNAEATIS
jgi:hypothetical protein